MTIIQGLGMLTIGLIAILIAALIAFFIINNFVMK